jgi:hypothetical protein
VTLSRRDRALLIAAAEGRCDVVPSGVPDLRVDGLWFCDQQRAHVLMGAGLLARVPTVRSRTTVSARLTDAGRAALRASEPCTGPARVAAAAPAAAG